MMRLRPLLLTALLAGLITLTGCQTTQSDGKPLTERQVIDKREAIIKMARTGVDTLIRQNPKVADEIKKSAGYAVFNASNVNIVLVVLSNGDGALFEPGQKPVFMMERKAGEGLGAGYQKQYQVLIFKNQEAIKQFTAAKGVGGDVNANLSAGSGGQQRSINPNVTTYLVGESGYDLQANWGGSIYTPNDTLNNPDIKGGY
jgi:predicted small secreted protein